MMLSRRALLGSALAATAVRSPPAWPQKGPAPSSAPVTVLQLERRTIEVSGKPATVFGIRQPDGTYGITTEVGKRFRVRVENNIDAPSLIHWHGLTPPWQQDGVPGISGPPIPPGGGRRLQLSAALRRHLLDAFAPGAAGAAADGSAADHSRSARPARPAGNRRRAGRFQLHPARSDICRAEGERQQGSTGRTGWGATGRN